MARKARTQSSHKGLNLRQQDFVRLYTTNTFASYDELRTGPGL